MAQMIDLTDPNAQAAQMDLDRRQKMADYLRQQALAPMDTNRMAGGYVIPINPLEGLAKMGQAYFAGQEQKNISDTQAKMLQDRANRISTALKNYGKVTETTQPDMSRLMTASPDGSMPQTFDFKSRPATPEEQMQQDWQLTQLDPSFAKVLESRHAREQAQQDKLEQIRLQRELAAQQLKASQQPYFTPLQTAQGVYSFNARSGQVAPVMAGQGSPQLVGAQFDPRLQSQIAGAKTGATEFAKATTAAQTGLPQVVATADDLSRHIDEMIGSKGGEIKPHPGMGSYLGSSGMLGYVPKTEAADFKSRLEQLQGGTFLQAYNTLRGGGQITEVEGAKATAALNRAKAAQNEQAFKTALRDFQDVVQKGADRARQAAQGNFAVPEPAAPLGGAVNNTDLHSRADAILRGM